MDRRPGGSPRSDSERDRLMHYGRGPPLLAQLRSPPHSRQYAPLPGTASIDNAGPLPPLEAPAFGSSDTRFPVSLRPIQGQHLGVPRQSFDHGDRQQFPPPRLVPHRDEHSQHQHNVPGVAHVLPMSARMSSPAQSSQHSQSAVGTQGGQSTMPQSQTQPPQLQPQLNAQQEHQSGQQQLQGIHAGGAGGQVSVPQAQTLPQLHNRQQRLPHEPHHRRRPVDVQPRKPPTAAPLLRPAQGVVPLSPPRRSQTPQMQQPPLMLATSQPPPLPPRQPMLAEPRSSAVMQSIPKVQRHPLALRNPQLGKTERHLSSHGHSPPRGLSSTSPPPPLANQLPPPALHPPNGSQALPSQPLHQPIAHLRPGQIGLAPPGNEQHVRPLSPMAPRSRLGSNHTASPAPEHMQGSSAPVPSAPGNRDYQSATSSPHVSALSSYNAKPMEPIRRVESSSGMHSVMNPGISREALLSSAPYPHHSARRTGVGMPGDSDAQRKSEGQSSRPELPQIESLAAPPSHGKVLPNPPPSHSYQMPSGNSKHPSSGLEEQQRQALSSEHHQVTPLPGPSQLERQSSTGSRGELPQVVRPIHDPTRRNSSQPEREREYVPQEVRTGVDVDQRPHRIYDLHSQDSGNLHSHQISQGQYSMPDSRHESAADPMSVPKTSSTQGLETRVNAQAAADQVQGISSTERRGPLSSQIGVRHSLGHADVGGAPRNQQHREGSMLSGHHLEATTEVSDDAQRAIVSQNASQTNSRHHRSETSDDRAPPDATGSSHSVVRGHSQVPMTSVAQQQTSAQAATSMAPYAPREADDTGMSSHRQFPVHDVPKDQERSQTGGDHLQNGPQQPVGATSGQQRRQLKVEDALAYLEQVKTQFADQAEVYNSFLDIMKAFKAQSIDTSMVIIRVSELFRGNKDLILGFNTFLPPGYKIQVTEDLATGMLNTGYSGPTGYSELPAQPKTEPNALSSQQNLLPRKKTPTTAASPKRKDGKGKQTSAGPGNMSVSSIPAQDDEMRQDDREPEPSTPSPPPETESPKKSGPSHVSKVHSSPGPVALSVSKGATRGIGPDPNVGNGLSEGSPLANTAMGGASSINRLKGFEKAIAFVVSLKDRLSDTPERYTQFLDVLNQYRHEPKGIKEVFEAVADLLGPNKDLLAEFKEFLPAAAVGSSLDDPKRKLAHPTSFGRNRIVGKSFGSVTAFPKGHARSQSARVEKGSTQEVQIFDYIREQLGASRAHLYEEFIKCVSLFSLEIITKDELVVMASELLRNPPDALNAFLSYLDTAACEELDSEADDAQLQASSSTSSAPVAPVIDAERLKHFREKPVSEIATESKVHGTTSYRALPQDFPRLTCSNRTPLERKTLNDSWVSVTQGSEENAFKFMRKNNYEDSLFRSEDDRYELDMVIAANTATILTLEPIAATIKKLPSEVKNLHGLVDGALKGIHFNAIQRIYGEAGPDVIVQVKLNPSNAIPIVLARLKEKDAVFRRSLIDLNSIWRDVGEKNYYRALDHRTVFFKSAEKKDINPKTLLADILNSAGSEAVREAEQTRLRGYAVAGAGGSASDRTRTLNAISNAARNVSPLSAQTLELPYYDEAVHKHAFQLLKTAIEKELPGKDSSVVVNLFRRLLSTLYQVDLDDGVETGNSGVRREQLAVVLYGDETIYILIRYYDLIFERLAAAKAASVSVAEDQKNRNEMNSNSKALFMKSEYLKGVTSKPSQLLQKFTPTTRQEYFSLSPQSSDPTTLWNQFLDVLQAFLAARIDYGKYEDRCRVLLGTKSYLLLTFDKLLAKSVRHIICVCSGDSWSKQFLNLFHHARERISTLSTSATPAQREGAESLYCAAASEYLRREKGAGANFFRMQFLRGNESGGFLTIHAFGRTCSDEDEKIYAAIDSEVDKFLGFCQSSENAVAKYVDPRSESNDGKGNNSGKQNLYRDDGKRLADAEVDREKGSSNKKASGHGKRKASHSGSPTLKRQRVSFQGGKPFLERLCRKCPVEGRDLFIQNDLEFKIDIYGRLVYVVGGCDFLVNSLRKWGSPMPPGDSHLGKKVKALLGLGDEDEDGDKNMGSDDAPDSDKDVAKMDIDSTESEQDRGDGTESSSDDGGKGDDESPSPMADSKPTSEIIKTEDSKAEPALVIKSGKEATEKISVAVQEAPDAGGDTCTDSSPKASSPDAGSPMVAESPQEVPTREPPKAIDEEKSPEVGPSAEEEKTDPA